MTETEARQLADEAQQAADTLRSALYMLHHYDGYKLLGYATWAAFVEAELGQSARTIRNYLQQADAEQRLQQAGWQHVAASGRALVALQRLVVEDENGEPDASLMQTVYKIASDGGAVKVTTDRVKAALRQIDQTVNTGAVEIEGEQYPVWQGITRQVNAEVHEATNRDNCRWIASRLTGQFYNVFNGTYCDGTKTVVTFRSEIDLKTLFTDLEGKQVVISIGIEDEVNT